MWRAKGGAGGAGGGAVALEAVAALQNRGEKNLRGGRGDLGEFEAAARLLEETARFFALAPFILPRETVQDVRG